MRRSRVLRIVENGILCRVNSYLLSLPIEFESTIREGVVLFRDHDQVFFCNDPLIESSYCDGSAEV